MRTAVMDQMPDAAEFHVSIVSPERDTKGAGTGLVELLDWTLSIRRECALLPTLSRASDDPLFLYGTRS